nr:reverse transcriptase domain-containing protein [Tanacetum cinerariifolium]
PSHSSSFVSPSCKRSSPATSVPLSSPVPRALSSARVVLLPSPKRIKSPESATDLEGCSEDGFKPYVPREAGLGVDNEDESFEPSRSRETDVEVDDDVKRSDGLDIDLEIQAEIDECIAYVNTLRARGIDARVVVEAVDRDEVETGASGQVEVRAYRVTRPVIADDIPKPAQEGVVEVTYETLGGLVQRFRDYTVEIPVHRVQAIESIHRDQGYRIVATGQQSADMMERIKELEQDNRRLRDMMDVESQRVTQFRRRELRVQMELRQIRHFRFYDRMRIAMLEACARRHLGYHSYIEEVNRNGGNRNEENGNEGVNRNGNRNRGGYSYNFSEFMPARECTCQDFLKCHPLNFNGTKGVVRLNRWFEKMETVFHISNCLEKRFQELVLLCTRMVPNKEDKVERFVGEVMKTKEGWGIAQGTIMDSNQVFKRQNVRGQNVARAYTAENNEKKGNVESLLYYNKCKLHHPGPCTVRCGNCKKVDHMTRDCTAAVTLNTQRALVGNQRENKTGNKNGNKTGNQTGGNKATATAYAIRGGGANPNSNVVTGTFLLNNYYTSMLFYLGDNKSFVSSTFSELLDVAPSTLDTSYAIELADGRISETNVVLRGCTLGLLGHPFDINLMPVELGSFELIIGMDWLPKYHTVIVCDEKVVRIHYGDEVLTIRGDDCDGGSWSKLKIISCIKTQKYIEKICQVYLAQVTSKKTEDKSKEKRLEDVPIVREFLKC